MVLTYEEKTMCKYTLVKLLWILTTFYSLILEQNQIMRYCSILLVLILGLLSCQSDKSSKAKSTETIAAKKKIEMAGISKLYERYHDNPTTIIQKEENRLIDYAVDKELDVKRTGSGLYYAIHQQGQGANYQHGQPCKAHYSGYTLDGKIFDSSHKRGQPIMFNVGQMIPGWNEALKMMNPGTKAQLLIPSRLAYGERGFPNFVKPNEPLIFDLELLPLTAQ